MNFYKLKLQYQGTHYQGWQLQKEALKTVQGQLNKALQQISKEEEIKTLGASRTDAGVHALAQIVKIEMNLKIDPYGLVKALNTKLPDDIRALEAEIVPTDFHPIYHCKNKEYVYLFSMEKPPSVIQKDWIAHCAYLLNQKKIKEACELFVGEHDFVNFQCVGSEVDSTIRKIFECEYSGPYQNSLLNDTPYFMLRVRGNGFLKQMVRLMVGALWEIGREKISLLELQEALEKPLSQRLGPTAPPQGLFLKDIVYLS